ncbi:MAG: pantetheine-phosphate adenylyltransferase [Lachnospiraceae bacterium]|nr:pantetheine-phosphate adenylyltransferase [Lachnospiraceae bacterium]
MKKAIYPGSFDPVTLGHIDVIERASKLFDYLIIGVLNNRAKNPLFSVEERVTMLEKVAKALPNVEVRSFGGLTVDFAKDCNANAVVRGLRAVTDFEYELQIAQLNRVISPVIDTVFLTTNLKYAYLSSSTVKEVAAFGGDISSFVTPYVEHAIHKKLEEKRNGLGTE